MIDTKAAALSLISVGAIGRIENGIVIDGSAKGKNDRRSILEEVDLPETSEDGSVIICRVQYSGMPYEIHESFPVGVIEYEAALSAGDNASDQYRNAVIVRYDDGKNAIILDGTHCTEAWSDEDYNATFHGTITWTSSANATNIVATLAGDNDAEIVREVIADITTALRRIKAINPTVKTRENMETSVSEIGRMLADLMV